MDTYKIYDINLAYNKFVERWGVEPNGILMHEETYSILKLDMEDVYTKVSKDAKITFMGKPIYKTKDMEVSIIRFVI